jgi:polyhydroxybutyrate depolymerase
LEKSGKKYSTLACLKTKLNHMQKKETKQGSGLIFVVILMFVILGMVITLSSITVLETKMSQKTKSSVGAFFSADSGVEWALNQIANSSGSATIASAFPDFNNGTACPAGSSCLDCPFGGCKVYLLDSEGKVVTNPATSISEVKAVRSVGSQGGETQRAVEAAVGGKGPGDYDFSLEHDGIERTYKVHVPPSYNKYSPTPVIINLHGGGGNAEGQIEVSRMNETSDEEGFIVVYPNGTGTQMWGRLFGTWNSGSCCGSARDENVDDVGFISRLIDEIESEFSVDKKRVFATGYSNGAMMAMKLACEISDKIAAISTVTSTQTISGCALNPPVSMIHFHGTEDHCHYYDGGMCGGCFAEFFNSIGIPMAKDEYACESAETDIANWRTANGCDAGETGNLVYQNGSASCVSYDQCPGDGEVEFCTIVGMGHTWPGGDSYAIEACKPPINPIDYIICEKWKATLGPETNDINANDAMWEFFENHPKP